MLEHPCSKCKNENKTSFTIDLHSELKLSDCDICHTIQTFLDVTDRQQLVPLLPSYQTAQSRFQE